MKNIDLIKDLEEISLNNPQRVLKISGYLLKDTQKEYLELIIYRGFSSSTTHPIEIDPEKNVIDEKMFFTHSELYVAPLSEYSKGLLEENKEVKYFLNQNSWE